jgi:glycosyltransferase involved in cell wall biosynthesis
MNKFGLSIVLPAYNEAGNLPGLIGEISAHLRNKDIDYEIIIVNDGSRDNSKDVIQSLKTASSHVVGVEHETNKGYGAAVRSGFNAATKEWVFFTDSDRQFNFSEIEKLLEIKDSADIIAGYRYNRQDPFIRKLNAGIFNLAIDVLFWLWVRDIDCAFKLIRREVIQKANLESNGALINSELLVRAKRMGYKIKQVPVTHLPRKHGKQTGANIKVILRAVKEVLLFRITGRTVASK